MLKYMFFINWELVHCEECKKAFGHAKKKTQNPAEPPQLTKKNETTLCFAGLDASNLEKPPESLGGSLSFP